MTRLYYRASAPTYSPFNALLRDFLTQASDPSTTYASELRVDVKEAANEYTVFAELPGVAKEDIQVEINGTDVKIAAETKADEASLKVARSYSRSFSLPAELDDEKAAAQYENGLLRLTLPKKAANAAKRLMIA